MIKLRAYASEKDLALAVSEFLREHGIEAAKNIKQDDDPEAEHFYDEPTNKFVDSFKKLTALIEVTMNEQSSTIANDLLAKVILGAWIVGTAAVISPEVKKKIAERKTARMRMARSEKPKEAARTAAVLAEHGASRPVVQPWKDADAILSAVNRRLAEAGFKPVKVDVVRRRLKKLPRS